MERRTERISMNDKLVNVDKSKKVFKEFQDVIVKNRLTACEAMMIVSELHTCLLMDRISQSNFILGKSSQG